jgi:hypothetical protein
MQGSAGSSRASLFFPSSYPSRRGRGWAPGKRPSECPKTAYLWCAETTPCKITPPQGDPQGCTFVSIPTILDQHSVVDPVRSCSSLRAGPVPAWRSTLPHILPLSWVIEQSGRLDEPVARVVGSWATGRTCSGGGRRSPEELQAFFFAEQPATLCLLELRQAGCGFSFTESRQ